MTPVLHPMGERAVLAECGSLDEVLRLRAALADRPLDGVLDLVPAARTVLVPFDPLRVSAAGVRAWIARGALAAEAGSAEGGEDADPVDVPVRYDGPDLADTARLLGLSADALARRHRATAWRVAFTGFAPGFAYLVGDDWPFDVPRLSSPRTRVPAGAVGVAGAFTGAYPRETPGGWRLLATTDAVLFDPSAPDPALLHPGARVRFVDAPRPDIRAAPADSPPAPAPQPASHPLTCPIDGVPRPANPDKRASQASADGRETRGDEDVAARGILVVRAGFGATVQDLGRDGRASLGVARSGALDRGALRRANRLVGNPEDAAALEVVLGGFVAVSATDTWVAVSGAPGVGHIGGRVLDRDLPAPWPAGQELSLSLFTAGARAYLAVRGGLSVPPQVGARATDTLAGLGHPPLAAGDDLPLGDDPDAPVPAIDLAPWGAADVGPLEIDLAPGPRGDWFAPAALDLLFDAIWTVTGDSDRVGMRLDGPELSRVHHGELSSEGMVPGALQVPPSGRPTILLADGPVTGGYPVIAVVADSALDALAQARPGARLRFRHARRAD